MIYFDNSKNNVQPFFQPRGHQIFSSLILNILLNEESGIERPTFLQPN
jgi:hypothetical protein